MYETQNKDLLSNFENIFDILFSLESVIKLTKNACLDKEITSNYYNLSSNQKFVLSEERNNYINMLEIALDKVSNLKELNVAIEKELMCLK